MSKTFFLCGIGGSGVSALITLLLAQGHHVTGSDRSYDRGDTPEKYKLLTDLGVKLAPQDGSGVTADVDVVVVSSAVEDTVPDIKAAKDQNIQIRKRADILAEMFNAAYGVSIAGTSGKTTTTAMVGHMLRQLGRDPSIVNGGIMVNLVEQGILPGNAVAGAGELFVTETDESDGSIALFHPKIAVLNNIALDHKPVEELRGLFGEYLAKASTACVINADNTEALALKHHCQKQIVTYGIENNDADLNAVNLQQQAQSVRFDVNDVSVSLQVPGAHNVSNALAALSVAHVLCVALKDAAQALSSFKGTRRRMEVVGQAKNITVIDDFAHNPDKIAASLKALRQFEGRILAIWQPHGFGPTKMMKDELIESFSEGLAEGDLLLLPEIYYAGGTAVRSISSRELVDGVNDNGRKAHFFETRAEIVGFVKENAREGDRVIVMGARDDTLTIFANDILKSVSS